MRDALLTPRTRRFQAASIIAGQKARTTVVQGALANLVASGSLAAIDTATFGFLEDAAATDSVAITAADRSLTSADNPWSASDVGKIIHIAGAGTAGAVLVSRIAAFVSAGAVEIADAAVTSVTPTKTSAAGLAAWGWPAIERQADEPVSTSAGAVYRAALQQAVGGVTSRSAGERAFDVVNVKEFGAIGDGVTDDTAAINAAIAAIASWGRAGYIGTLYFPRGDYLTGAISHPWHSLRLRGDGGSASRIVHKDGEAAALITISGGTAGPPYSAAAWGGASGISFVAGDSTTYLIYVEGQIDNNTVWDDLSFVGKTSNASMVAAFSARDYLNMHWRKVRWDYIRGWGVEFRDATKFGFGYLAFRDVTYDATVGMTGCKGFLKIDNSGSNVSKGPVVIDGFRLEVNSALTSEAGLASLIRVSLNAAAMDAGAYPTVTVRMTNGTIAIAAVAKDMRILGWNTRDLAWSADNFQVYGPTVIAQNDTNDALESEASNGTAAESRFEQFSVGLGRFQSNAKRSRNGRRFIRNALGYLWGERGQRGDIWWNDRPGLSGVGRFAAAVQAQDDDGIHTNGDGGALCTGSINAASATLAFTGPNAAFIPGVRISVPGAGAAAATLNAKVISIDYTGLTAVLDTVAGTTVAGVACTRTNAQLGWIPIVFRSNTVPATGTYLQGDRACAENMSATQPVAEWACTVAGTPGTWRAVKWITIKGTTAARPTLTASDIGVQYLDTTLDADGKLIIWTGTAWVDATGAVV